MKRTLKIFVPSEFSESLNLSNPKIMKKLGWNHCKKHDVRYPDYCVRCYLQENK